MLDPQMVVPVAVIDEEIRKWATVLLALSDDEYDRRNRINSRLSTLRMLSANARPVRPVVTDGMVERVLELFQGRGPHPFDQEHLRRMIHFALVGGETNAG